MIIGALPGIVSSSRQTNFSAAPTRYWRLLMLGGWTTSLSFSSLEMATEPGGADICTGGTTFGNFNSIANAFDGNTATMTTRSGRNDGSFGYIFPTPVNIEEIRLRSDNSYDNASIAFAFQASHDEGVTWESRGLYFTALNSGTTRTFAVLPTALPSADRAQARVWRLNASARGGGVTSGQAGLSELIVAATPGGPQLALNGAVSLGYTNTSESLDWGGRQLVNGNIQPGAYSNFGANAPWIFGILFASPVDIQQMRVQGPGTTAAGPTTFTIEWSSDGGTYHVTNTYSGITWSFHGQEQAFAVSP